MNANYIEKLNKSILEMGNKHRILAKHKLNKERTTWLYFAVTTCTTLSSKTMEVDWILAGNKKATDLPDYQDCLFAWFTPAFIK